MSDTFTSAGVEWFADAEKLKLILEIEILLEESFTAYDLEGLYRLIQSYVRHTKTIIKEEEGLNKDGLKNRLIKITEIYQDWREDTKNPELKASLFYEIEELFSDISYALQKKRIYLREGKDASRAILNR